MGKYDGTGHGLDARGFMGEQVELVALIGSKPGFLYYWSGKLGLRRPGVLERLDLKG